MKFVFMLTLMFLRGKPCQVKIIVVSGENSIGKISS